MNKEFFKVFPTLRLKRNLYDVFQDTTVERVVTNLSHTKIRLYILSPHLILKKDIREVQGEISRQQFGSTGISVEIIDTYALEGEWSPETVMDHYRGEFEEELREKSEVLFHLFSEGECHFEDGDTLVMCVDDNLIFREMSGELEHYFAEVFRNKFGFSVTTRMIYRQRNRDEPGAEEAIKTRVKDILTHMETFKENEEVTKKKGRRRGNASRDGRLLFGRDFEDEVIPIAHIEEEMGEVVIRGILLSVELREIKNKRTILSMSLSDYTDSIRVKMFVKNEKLSGFLGEMKEGEYVKIKGVSSFDAYEKELCIRSVAGIKKISDFTKKRQDTAGKKRIELHCHTKMSDMDAMSDVTNLLKRAHDWGHKAIAITDHGVVQAFPEANHYIEKLDRGDDFKVIYGMEGYLVDDLQDMAINVKGQTFEDSVVVFDLETTGLSAISDRIIEIGAVKIEKGVITEKFSTFVHPGRPIPRKITRLTDIDDAMVAEAPGIESVLPAFLEFVGDAVLAAHNASFDVKFIEQNMRYLDMMPDFTYVDTVAMARVLLPQLGKYKLNAVAKALNIRQEHHHRAVDDARVTSEIFLRFLALLKEKSITDFAGLNTLGKRHGDAIKKMPSHHVILLAKNDVGRVNLYTLVSKSHLDYFYRRPRIPKSLLSEYREGLLVGSACEAGEVYSALVSGEDEGALSRLVSYYDYLEIQPVANNHFMVESDRFPRIESDEDIREMNREIVSLGHRYHKPVVATGDVHFLDPGDDVYRKIILAGKGYKDGDQQPPLYLRTTEEMLEEFAYLGEDKALEIVVDNPAKIADMVEKISPVRPDKCPPKIADSDIQLREICEKKAKDMYGEPLPKMVAERLERELNAIISNGYAVMYIISQKLVWKSNEDGYLVGSRGSVGSSFAATMAGITEVNPLPPHYYCRDCHYSEFDTQEVRAYAGGCGFDMPDKNCPRCGKKLVKDGFDIPFETFMGFRGNKEPDIDLNFSGEYQSQAHKYTEVIFGEGQTFRAGTIGTLADKTAYGYVSSYFEERGIHKRRCEIERLVRGCTGIRRSTGQHPGGIVVLPHGENIYSFTPIQHPANDMNTEIITTHFDYHSIDHNLLKLDILGHDDPTMIKEMEGYIHDLPGGENFCATEIPLDDKDVMSLFHGTKALGIKPEDIGGCPLGCLGIPEFGTEFVIQMVVEAKPARLSDLIRISGLSHGTDVWVSNAQDLIRNGKATISTAICTRDDIMTFLINSGMESELSFTIMEGVRKGKGLKPEQEKAMKEAGIPDWYIDSCKKIKYMFPKAHAAAYVMMAYRIAYCKINYPLAYYAAYFSIRADAFSYEIMCQGKEHLDECLREFAHRKEGLTKKEQDTMKDMKIVREMYARGLEFLPIDLYASKASRFQIVEGKLLPSFLTIEGLGEKAAEQIEEAGKKGKYISREDFRQRSKVSKTVAEHMVELGILRHLPGSNQLSLFDD